MLMNIRDHLAEEIAAEHHADNPTDTADDVVGNETLIFHGANACDHWRKGPDNRHEARDDDRKRAMTVVKLLGRDQVFFVEQERVFPAKKFRTGARADIVSDSIASDRCDGQCYRERQYFKITARGE